MRQSKRYLIWAACAAATMTALPAQANMYSCERYSNDASGFISFAAYESWHPKKMVLNSNKETGRNSHGLLIFFPTTRRSPDWRSAANI